MKLRAILAFLLTVSTAHAAPVWWESVVNDTKLPIPRMERVLTTACTLTTQKSLKPVTARELTETAVKSLSTFDQKITAALDGKRVILFADDKVLKSFSAPDENDCENWSRLLLAAAVEARPFSPKAQKADAEEFYNIFINAYLGTLDSYAHFEGDDSTELTALKNPASIGIRYRRIGRFLEITAILPDSPASQSDIQIGDRITAIEGKSVPDLSRVQILNALRGEAGTTVSLTIHRDGKTRRELLTRRAVVESPVAYFFDEQSRLMTIKIAAFSKRTVPSLKATLKIAEKQGAKGLIIDLRGNMGGLLKEAVLAADIFLPPDLLMIRTQGRGEADEQEYWSTKKNNRPVYPTAILVDAKTASSAEYFAGVLQDYRHATVIGTPTYGKGVLQSVDSVKNAGELSVTTARYLLPSGYSPDIYGVFPNICTSGLNLVDIDKVPPAQTRLLPWKKGDAAVKSKALRACPRQIRSDNALDDEIAKRILTDSKQYNGALTYFSLDSFLK